MAPFFPTAQGFVIAGLTSRTDPHGLSDLPGPEIAVSGYHFETHILGHGGCDNKFVDLCDV